MVCLASIDFHTSPNILPVAVGLLISCGAFHCQDTSGGVEDEWVHLYLFGGCVVDIFQVLISVGTQKL